MGHFTFPLAGDSVFPLDATSDESTAIIFTMPNNGAFKPILVQIWAVQVTGFTTSPSISVGTNANNYDDVMPVTQVVPTAGARVHNILLTNARVLDANDVLRARVATAAGATIFLLRITILGHFV